MQSLLMAGLLVIGQAPQPQDRSEETPNQKQTIASPLSDGQWTVVCAEKNGQSVDDAKGKAATVRDGVITWSHEGKECSARLHFLPRGRVYATEMTIDGRAVAATNRGAAEAQEPTKTEQAHGNVPNVGVFVATKDMVCLCLHHDQFQAGKTSQQAGNGAQFQAGKRTQQAGNGTATDENKLVLILKKGT